MATGTGSPCGACKFLRRRCVPDCVFAPYFSCDQGAARFAAIHKVFGASNISKLLMHLPVADRCEAVVTIAYEAQARIKDPVYGCVAQIFALQQQVAILQAQVMQTKAQIAYGLLEVQSSQRNQSEKTVAGCTKRPLYYADYYTAEGALMQETGLKDEIISNQLVQCNKRFAGHSEIGDLQSLAFTMMNSSQS
ncbi:LOB domain-containing protein 16-like protein [Carex littledalei]|uniref:LOB domain-containing protein 16-like protein n=1 Tax=Carex littledalei TaxID=544730 RepID=A0A833VDI8_9POAL|nr:LOB domain-containing protein 16-like protein [Carex littledalei]